MATRKAQFILSFFVEFCSKLVKKVANGVWVGRLWPFSDTAAPTCQVGEPDVVRVAGPGIVTIVSLFPLCYTALTVNRYGYREASAWARWAEQCSGFC